MWHLIDARDQLVGRLATQITPILRGKHKPTFSPNYDCGDYVVIINAQHCKFSGNKEKQKLYSWHTGYPGGIKHTNPATMRATKPEEVRRRVCSHDMILNIYFLI
jgi:large subunit ribosomal protein L13